LSLNASKPVLNRPSEEPDCAAYSLPTPTGLPGYSQLAHTKLEVQVRYCEHRSATTRPGERRAREVAELFSASLAAVALQGLPRALP